MKHAQFVVRDEISIVNEDAFTPAPEQVFTVTRHDTPTIQDGWVVRYEWLGGQVSASRNGVLISGFGDTVGWNGVAVLCHLLQRAALHMEFIKTIDRTPNLRPAAEGNLPLWGQQQGWYLSDALPAGLRIVILTGEMV